MDKRSVRRLLGLGFLSPRIVEAITGGRQPPELTVIALSRRLRLPLLWSAQEEMLCRPEDSLRGLSATRNTAIGRRWTEPNTDGIGLSGSRGLAVPEAFSGPSVIANRALTRRFRAIL
jgi:hypothetical protein